LLYADADITQEPIGTFIQEAPVVVVAETGDKVESGNAGVVKQADGTAWPAQKYQFTLTIRKALRGDLSINDTISVFGYERESPILIGAPQGICGRPNQLGVYFLRRNGASFRVMKDVYRTWIPLDPRTDLQSLNPTDSTALSIWRLMIDPLQSGARRTTHAELSSISQVTQQGLGFVNAIQLLLQAMNRSQSMGFKAETCVWLNSVHSGLGFEGCASKLLNQSGIGTDERKKLQAILVYAPRANQTMRSYLSDESQLGFWARGEDAATVEEFLCLLARHPDGKTSGLANMLLKKRGVTRSCLTILR